MTLPPQAMHSSSISLPAASTRADLPAVALVEQQDRMYVAVAGMGHVDDPHAVLRADFARSAAASCGSRVRGTTPSWMQ